MIQHTVTQTTHTQSSLFGLYSFGKFRVVNWEKGYFLPLGMGPYNGPKIVGLTALSLYLYFFKIVPFWLRNIRFLIQNTRSLFYGRHYSSLHRLMSLHRKINVKIFLMFIIAENTGSVNIFLWMQPVVSDVFIFVLYYFMCRYTCT